MIHVQGLRRNVKNVVKNYSDAQVKVREATSNDPWGPSGTLMSEIADLTYNVVAFTEIMHVIWKRLSDHGKNWKHVYKALVLLDYLIKTGSEKVTQQCRENLFAIQTLRDFQYFEEAKDQGVNVREKAKQLVVLLKDEERLKSERARALKARERFARSTSTLTKPDPVSRVHISICQDSFDEEMPSPGALSLSELEHARPQTVGEEELQLQLALAMSKEEADQAERLKRNDDLRLQMALSESKEEFKKVQIPEKPKVAQSASAMEDLLGLSLNDNVSHQEPVVDPWGFPLSPQNNSNAPDPWKNNLDVPEKNKNIVQNDPWSPPALDNSTSGLPVNSLSKASQDHLPSSDSNMFDVSSMRKSLSADMNTGSNTLDSFLNPESSLIHFDPTARSRTHGNPFQVAKPSPLTINELRAQTGTESTESTFPISASMPLSNTFYRQNNVSPSQNPFM